jgi:hypothetical protein
MRGAALAAALLLLAGSAAAQTADTVRVGNETKRAYGTITGMQAGDIACYLSLKDDSGTAFKEMADFDVCEKRALLNKRVALKYEVRRVQSPECQGDESCKKSVSVALVTDARPVAAAAPAVARTSFCTAAEKVVFSCTSGQKVVSVCAPKDAGPRKGYLEYRFGGATAEAPEITLPKERTVPSQAAQGGFDSYAGGGASWLRFRQGQFGYAVYTGIGNWGPKGEKREKAGLLVEKAGKQVAVLRCNGKYWSELGPDLVEKLDLKAGNEAFDYPD